MMTTVTQEVRPDDAVVTAYRSADHPMARAYARATTRLLSSRALEAGRG
jgi:hypothetical protein